MPAKAQVNIRTDSTFERDLATIQRDTRIPDRSNAIRHVVHREAARIRRRVRSTK
jgi:hypothetical protein